MDGALFEDHWKRQCDVVFKYHTQGRPKGIPKDDPNQELRRHKRLRGPIEEEVLKNVKRQRPNQEPEWHMLLKIPLAQLPAYTGSYRSTIGAKIFLHN